MTPLRGLYWLTWALGSVAILAAGLGYTRPWFYGSVDPQLVLPQLHGQDVFLIVFGVPGILAFGSGAVRHSLGQHLLWLGLAAHFAYHFALLACSISHGPLFLLHVLGLSLATIVLFGGAIRIYPERLEEQIKNLDVPYVATFAILAGGFLGGVWIVDIYQATMENRPPDMALQFGTPTSLVYVLDLAFVVPALIFGGLLTHAGTALGLLLLSVTLTQFLSRSLGTLIGDFFLIQAGASVDMFLACTFFAIALGGIWGLIRLKSQIP